MRRLRSARWLWPALAAIVACVPFARGFSLTRVFYIRDLAMFFWPRHLWIHRSMTSGSFPLWDPYAAAGQSVFSDALNQLFLPPVMLLRMLPPIAGFNLLVVAPFPLAALGMWLFLRRHVSDASAALGAVAFAASGSVVATGNFPNLSWSVAWIPWIVWAAQGACAAPSPRRFALLTATIALQMLSGEPVTMVGTLAMVVAYVVVCPEPGASIRARTVLVAAVAGAIVVAAIVSAVQLVPMALAAKESPRGLMRTDNFWSIHPLWLVESLLPGVFGDTFQQYDAQLPWIRPLNSGRDPFFYSIGVGLVVLLLAILGSLSAPRRRRVFWLSVVVVGVILSFGDYTPVYPLLQRMVPLLRSFRFPAKFLVLASFGLAALAADGAEALQERDAGARRVRALKATAAAGIVVALALVTLLALVLVAPFTGARMFYDLGARVGVADPVAGAAYLFRVVPPAASRALILLATAALLMYLQQAGGRQSRIAHLLLFGLATVELLAATAGLNPVLPASRLGPPAWTAAAAAHPSDRFYIGGKFLGTLAEHDIDLRGIRWEPLPGAGVEEARMLLMSNLAMSPAAWGVRELLSYDLPLLWPIEHARAVARFVSADRPERLRFLAGGGVRYCLLSSPPRPDAAPLRLVGEQFGTLAVYECVPDAHRAVVVDHATVVPDVAAQVERLFDASFDAESTVMLERAAAGAAGVAGAPSSASARITTDAEQQVAVAAAAGAGGGYLVLRDSYDPSWRVDVDGRPAPLLRANALYRAVHIAPGSHTVIFSYRPTVFYVCLIVSGLTAIALAAVAIRRQA